MKINKRNTKKVIAYLQKVQDKLIIQNAESEYYEDGDECEDAEEVQNTIYILEKLGGK